MRKVLFLVAFIILPLTAILAEDITEAERTFDLVVEAPGYTRDQLFDGVRVWLAKTFKSSKDVIDVQDRETGTVVGTACIDYPCPETGWCTRKMASVLFTIKIDTKDGKFRTGYSNITLITYNVDGTIMYNGPVKRKDDMDLIRPELLAFGDKILQSIKKEKTDW